MNQPVTVTFVPEQIITWMIVGLIAGLMAGLIVRGRGYSVLSSIVVGLLGAFLGGLIFSVLGLQLPPEFAGGITLAWSDIIIAFIGSIIILLLFGGFRYRRGAL